MRPKAFFINGGAGRVLCSIPAFEKYAEEVTDDFIIVCEGGMDFFKGHPKLHPRAYDHWHKNLFEDKLINMDIISPEPYRLWEYYNQKCNLSQAFDLIINGKGIRDLPKPTLKLNGSEQLPAKISMDEVREKTGKDKVVIFQPFGRGTMDQAGYIVDFSGRSFEFDNVVGIIKKLQKNYAVVLMSEFQFNFEQEGCQPVAQPQGIGLREWAAIIKEADHFLGCDSVGQHIAYSLDKTATVVTGSTHPINISYPGYEKFDILDMGEGMRRYSPIRVTMDEEVDRHNEGIMRMNDKIETVISDSVDKLIKKFHTARLQTAKPSITSSAPVCGLPPPTEKPKFEIPKGKK